MWINRVFSRTFRATFHGLEGGALGVLPLPQFAVLRASKGH